MMALFGFALAVAYAPWIAGAATTPRWAVLVLGAFVALVWLERPALAAIPRLAGAALLGWLLLTVVWSPALERFDLAWKFLLLAALFTAGSRLDDLGGLLTGCAWGVGVSSALVIAERLGWPWPFPAFNRPSGLFVNGLYLAEFAAMVLAGCVALRRWALAALCVPPLLLVASLPRGPLLALMVAGMLLWMMRPPIPATVGVLGAAAVLASMAVVLAAIRPDTVAERLQTWGDLLAGVTVFGHGLGSYPGSAPFLASVDLTMRKLHANNDLLELAFEAGAVGLVLAVAFLASLLWARSPAAPAIIVVVFLVEGLFGFPAYLPATAGLFALAAGHMARSA